MSEESKAGALREVTRELPLEKLNEEIRNLGQALAQRMLVSLTDKVEGMTSRLTDYVDNPGAKGLISSLTGSGESGDSGGGNPSGLLKGTVKGAIGGFGRAALGKVFGGLGRAVGLGRGKKAGKLKIINIVEALDIGAPLQVVYNQWTQFEEFPNFTKKVDSVNQEADEKVSWKAQVFWSHRSWKSTIVEQVPDKRIIWRSEGPKGYVDGAVTFDAIAPELTRVNVVLEYHPQGAFEHIGNLWRAQGRRARLELKHIKRHIMTQTMLHPDQVQGWRGEIHDGKVVKDQETALREESAAEEAPEAAPEEEGAEETRGPERAEAEEPEEEEYEERAEAEEPEEEYEEPERAEAEEPEEEYEEPRRAAAEAGELEEEEPEEAEAERRAPRREAYERPERTEPPVRRRRPEEERPAHPPRRAGARRS